MASNLTVDTLTKGATTLNTDELVDVNNTRVCKAWVNFNGVGTVAIRASYNVSSLTDRGTGRYTVNLTTSMPDSNYATLATAQDATEGSTRTAHARRYNSASYYISVENSSSGYTDAEFISSCIFR